MTYLDFLKTRKVNNIININEDFKGEDIKKAFEKIDSILSKKIVGLIPLVGYEETTISNKSCISKQYIVQGKKAGDASMFQFNFLKNSDSISCYSIDFCKDLSLLFSGEAKSDLSIYTLGGSLVKFLPIVWTIANSKNYDLTQEEIEKTIKNDKNNIKESNILINNINYNIYRNLPINIIDETFNIVINRINENVNIGDPDEESEDGNVKLGVKNNVSLKINEPKNKELKKAQDAHEDPDVVFKKMEGYIKMIINGLSPSLIICGAPGLGKTFRVKKLLKESGYKEDYNMYTIKGKCTPRQLYLRLYEYQDKNNILVIDDADGLVGPKAPEECINILKAALDSSEDDQGRLVSYGVTGNILDDDGDQVPKRFYYNGGVIVITNYNAGQLNSALKNRSYIQDINFNIEDTLKIIKDVMPHIMPDVLSDESKKKAFNYLEKLSKNKNNPIELSLRSFGICAKLFENGKQSSNLTDEVIELMIKEQMILQAQRGGHAY